MHISNLSPFDTDDEVRLRTLVPAKRPLTVASSRVLQCLATSLLENDTNNIENIEMDTIMAESLRTDPQLTDLLEVVKSRI